MHYIFKFNLLYLLELFEYLGMFWLLGIWSAYK